MEEGGKAPHVRLKATLLARPAGRGLDPLNPPKGTLPPPLQGSDGALQRIDFREVP